MTRWTDPSQVPLVLSIGELSEGLGVSRSALQRWEQAGHPAIVRLPGQGSYVCGAAVKRWMAGPKLVTERRPLIGWSRKSA